MTRARAVLGLVLLSVAACEARDARPASIGDSAAPAQLAASAPPSDTPRAMTLHARFRTIGRAASRSDIRAWDIDVNGSGVGLPSGRGTYQRGAQVYAQQCASCHGASGEGVPPSPKLVGAEPKDFSFGKDPKLTKTIGNYWPYATTLYDYVNRAMPFNTPGSLSPDDVYSVVAYLLAENGVIGRNVVMDAKSLPLVHMPARDRFVRDNRTGGAVFR